MSFQPRRVEIGFGFVVTEFIGPQEVAQIEREADPFGIAHMCPNPAGHQPIVSCGEIVCAHCGLIFWR